MGVKMLERLPALAATTLTVLAIAACTIHLREDDGQRPSVASVGHAVDPAARKLEQCRSVADEQEAAAVEREEGQEEGGDGAEDDQQRSQPPPVRLLLHVRTGFAMRRRYPFRTHRGLIGRRTRHL